MISLYTLWKTGSFNIISSMHIHGKKFIMLIKTTSELLVIMWPQILKNPIAIDMNAYKKECKIVSSGRIMDAYCYLYSFIFYFINKDILFM